MNSYKRSLFGGTAKAGSRVGEGLGLRGAGLETKLRAEHLRANLPQQIENIVERQK